MRKLSVALVAFLALSSCASKQTRINQGEAITTGNAQYDAFFGQVRDLRAEALRAEEDERAAHAGLVKALGLEEKSDASSAVGLMEQRAKKYRDAGVLLHLDIVPEPKLVQHRGSASLDAQAEATLKAIEESAKASLALEKRLGALTGRAKELEKQRADLRAQTPATFKGDPQAKRDEITAELDASEGVLASASDLGSRSAGRASRFVIELAKAVETGAGDAPAAAAPPTSTAVAKAKPPTTWKKPPGSVANAPASGATKPAAATTKPAKKGKGDDFEP